MIHHKDKNTTLLEEFFKKYFQIKRELPPLVVVPSAYSHVTEKELSDFGAKMVIYANHLLRSAYPAMRNVAETILKNKRAEEAEEYCMPIKEILNLIPGTR